MEKNSDNKSKEGRFGWLNKPFTLWFLSSVILGLIAFSYKNYSTCRTDLSKDEEEFRLNVYELNQRWSSLDSDLRKWPAGSNEQFEIVKRYLDRSAYFFSVETKDKNRRDLALTIERVTRKWHPDWSTLEATQNYRFLGERMTPLGLAPSSNSLVGGPRLAGILSNAWDLVSRYTGLDEAARRWISRPYTLGQASPSYNEFAKIEGYMRGSGYGFAKLLFDQRDVPFLLPDVCRRKALWPF